MSTSLASSHQKHSKLKKLCLCLKLQNYKFANPSWTYLYICIFISKRQISTNVININ